LQRVIAAKTFKVERINLSTFHYFILLSLPPPLSPLPPSLLPQTVLIFPLTFCANNIFYTKKMGKGRN
jgi:hypothetical protein